MANVLDLRVALIGSRLLEKDPQYADDVLLCYKICYRLARLGVRFTSGLCALGMDGIAQKAYSRALEEGLASPEQFEVYVIDQKAINKSPLPNRHLARIRNPNMIEETLRMASEVHPAWHLCGDYAKGQHSRNCHQVFGYTLDNPVDAVITWCPYDRKGEPTGGTATAIRLARKANIPVFNLWDKRERQQTKLLIRDFLEAHNVPNLKKIA